MKKFNLKKYALMLGTAASLALGNAKASYALESNTAIEAIKDRIQKTQNYYLVRIDGKTHLCIKLTHEDLNNYINRFYDIKDLKFVGQTLESDDNKRWQALTYNFKKKNRDQIITLVDDKMDYNYFNGEYGYQKNLPIESITSLTEFVSSEYPSQEEVNFFSSNSAKLNQLFENERIYSSSEKTINMYKIKKEFLLNSFVAKEKGEEIQTISLSKFRVTKATGIIDEFIGYRCSASDKDIGYHNIYDVITGKVIYIGKNSINSYIDVQEERLNDGITISVMKEELLQEKYQELEAVSLKKEKKEITEEIIPSLESTQISFKADEIYVIDAKSLFDTYHVNEVGYYKGAESYQKDCSVLYDSVADYQDYYFLKDYDIYTNQADNVSEILESGINILNPEQKVIQRNVCQYEKETNKCNVTLIMPCGSYTGNSKIYFNSINHFLELQGLQNMIQDSYTEEDIFKINNYLTHSFEAKDLYVFDSTRLLDVFHMSKEDVFQNEKINYCNPENYQDYYFMQKTGTTKLTHENYWARCFHSVFEGNEEFKHTYYNDGDRTKYFVDFEMATGVISSGALMQYCFKDINTFLQQRGLDDLQQERYTKEDLSRINEYLMQKGVERKRSLQ